VFTCAERGGTFATGDDPSLGCPVEYIDLRGTSKENPAVCKYTGNKYWSDDWKTPGRVHH
jgi:NADH dehydrogenase (ubiquinone) Fe-S protein 6